MCMETLSVRGVNSAKGPDSSVGGVPMVNSLDIDHMEEEVQVTDQEKWKEKNNG